MCGLTGIITPDWERPDQNLLHRMVRTLEHRGPDDEGYFIAPGIGMAHARLSIIDLEGGKQPIHNEDNSIQVIFNGEIFNYLELRAELKRKGHRFYTQTDTEVIVHLYEEYGADFPSHLNGQFAIVLWDSHRQQLWLARDRVGICPLFYTLINNKLLFASEIKALLASNLLAVELDPQALDQIFTFWYPQPPKTIFKNVFTLLPAEIISYEKDGLLTKKKYWHWNFADPGQYSPNSADELAEELRELLISAVQLRLRADVSVGCYLSGGLDSSAIAAMVRFHGSSELRTFSIGFDDPGLDESKHQLRMVHYLRTNHSTLACSPADIASRFMDTIAHTEVPVLRSAPVPMGMLSGLVRKYGYKVVLTGEGADEVFGGYDLFKEGKIRSFWAKQPDSPHRPMLLKRLYPYLNLPKGKAGTYLRNFFGQELEHTDLAWYAHLPRWLTTARCKEFFSVHLKAQLNSEPVEAVRASIPSSLCQKAPFNRWQYVEARGLMPAYLLSSQGDRMLMQHSVEGRFPFLDHRVIEFANRLAPKWKMQALNEKYILKRAMQGLVPKDISRRHKQPYRAPDIPAFFTPLESEFVAELLSREAIESNGYFDSKKVAMLLSKIRRGRAIGAKDNMAFLGILSTQAWHNIFVHGKGI